MQASQQGTFTQYITCFKENMMIRAQLFYKHNTKFFWVENKYSQCESFKIDCHISVTVVILEHSDKCVLINVFTYRATVQVE